MSGSTIEHLLNGATIGRGPRGNLQCTNARDARYSDGVKRFGRIERIECKGSVSLLHDAAFAEGVLHCDETPVQVLKSQKAATSDHYMSQQLPGSNLSTVPAPGKTRSGTAIGRQPAWIEYSAAQEYFDDPCVRLNGFPRVGANQ